MSEQTARDTRLGKSRISRSPARASACRICDDVYGLDATDRCRRYLARFDSDGRLYCANCGHTESVHPEG